MPGLVHITAWAPWHPLGEWWGAHSLLVCRKRTPKCRPAEGEGGPPAPGPGTVCAKAEILQPALPDPRRFALLSLSFPLCSFVHSFSAWRPSVSLGLCPATSPALCRGQPVIRVGDKPQLALGSL